MSWLTEKRALTTVAILQLAVAFGVAIFWIGFFTEALFPMAELAPLVDNFEGYLRWERCFVVPDTLFATLATIGGVRLLRNRRDALGRTLLTASSGAWLFLGVLDATYALQNGMYTLGHVYSYQLMEVGISLPFVGIVSLVLLHRTAPHPAPEGESS